MSPTLACLERSRKAQHKLKSKGSVQDLMLILFDLSRQKIMTPSVLNKKY